MECVGVGVEQFFTIGELVEKLFLGALNNVTRESVDSMLVKSGDKLVKKSLDVKG